MYAKEFDECSSACGFSTGEMAGDTLMHRREIQMAVRLLPGAPLAGVIMRRPKHINYCTWQ